MSHPYDPQDPQQPGQPPYPQSQPDPYSQNPYSQDSSSQTPGSGSGSQDPYAQSPYSSSSYGAQQYPYGQQTAPTNVLAIVALVSAFFIPVAGIVCGHLALGQIKRTGENGRGLALAGLIIGYVLTALIVLMIVLAIIIPLFILGTVGTVNGIPVE